MGRLAIAATLALGLWGCAPFPLGSSRDRDVSGRLEYRFLEYALEEDGARIDVVWTYDWFVGLAAALFPSTVGSNADLDARAVVYFREGKVDRYEPLGRDRARWIRLLKEHRRDFGDPWNEAILQGEIVEGMPAAAALMSWGHPQAGLRSNPSVRVATSRLGSGLDGETGEPAAHGADAVGEAEWLYAGPEEGHGDVTVRTSAGRVTEILERP
jgi:hypothetical protein